MSGRRLDVTATQAVSSMMAALTGAIAASSLGIAGTIIGAAFMSLASTVGAAIYKHYLARSNERLRAAATSLAPKASGNPVAAAVLRHHLHLDPDETAHLRPDGQAVVETQHDAETQAEDAGAQKAGARAADTDIAAERGAGRRAGTEREAGAGRRNAAAERPDSAEARVRPALAAVAFTRDDAVAAAVAADIAAAVLGDHTTLGHASLGYTAAEHPAPDLNGDPAGDGSTTADLRPTADLAEAADLHPAPDLGDAGGGRSGNRPRRRWLMLAGAMLGAFVVAMGAVTAVEAIAGKPLETLLWHRAGSGTTIGSVVHHSAHRHPATVPGTGPAPSQSSSAQPSSAPSGLVSPTPTPSDSVAPSTGTSSAPSSGTGSNSGTSTGTGTQAPGTPPAAGQ